MFKWLRDHGVIERNLVLMGVLTLITVSIGGLAQIVPLFTVESTIERVQGVRPYTPLELAGRDIYVREGCYTCHSQMVRPFRDEAERYGHYSLAAEFVYDHPFQWGSKRTGPDLAREGVGNNRKSDTWHFNHLDDPQSISTGSVMPAYSFLIDNALDTSGTAAKIRAMRTLGVPYAEGYEARANADLMNQASEITRNLKKDNINVASDREIVAVIAYLQRLGTDIGKNKTAQLNK